MGVGGTCDTTEGSETTWPALFVPCSLPPPLPAETVADRSRRSSARMAQCRPGERWRRRADGGARPPQRARMYPIARAPAATAAWRRCAAFDSAHTDTLRAGYHSFTASQVHSLKDEGNHAADTSACGGHRSKRHAMPLATSAKWYNSITTTPPAPPTTIKWRPLPAAGQDLS